MPLLDITKPRTDKRKSDIHTNKLLATTFRDQCHCATLKPLTNNMGKQEQKATLKKSVIKNINPRHQLDFITICCINNAHQQPILDSNPSERSATLEQYKLNPFCVSFRTTTPILQQQSHLLHCQAYREKNTRHTPFQVSATAWATVLTPLVKHSNPFGCLSDEDDNEAPTVESTLDSTTGDEFIGINGDAFYISTNLDQQQQLLDLSPSCCTSLGASLGASPGASPGTSPGTSLESVTMLQCPNGNNNTHLLLQLHHMIILSSELQ